MNHQDRIFSSASIIFTEGVGSTWGFMQAGLDVQTSAVCIAVLWFGLDEILLGF